MTGGDFRVTLLGTGVAMPSPDRFGPATLVDVGDTKVDHGNVIKPCCGYRFEYGERVAVLALDTRYNRMSSSMASGADLLVHEAACAAPELMKEAYVQRIIAHHTTPQDAGRRFAQTRPKPAAYTHIVQLGNELFAPPSLDEIVAEVRQT